MLTEFENYVRKNKLFTRKDKLLLALSGGQDSICLFHLLLKNNYSFAIAHCNFQLRGEDSLGDESFVLGLAKKHKIEAYSIRFNTVDESKHLKLSVQETARALRYQWFEKLRTEKAFTYILTAHHLSDNTETMLINLLRSTGVAGLHGIPLKQNFIVRPLLFAGSEKIKAYVKSKKLAFRHDISNDSDHYLRNKLRHTVIPALKEIDSNTDAIFSKVSENVIEYESFTENLLDVLKEKHFKKTRDGFFIKFDIFKHIKAPDLLMYYLLKPYGFNRSVSKSYKNIESLRVGAKHNAEHWLLHNERTGISLVRKLQTEPLEFTLAAADAVIKSKTIKITCIQIPVSKVNFKRKDMLYLNVRKCIFPMLIRPWKPGDKIQALGMKGNKKISDVLTDKKIENSKRQSQLVLVNGDGTLAALLPSLCSEQFKLTKVIKTALAVSVKNL